MFQTTLAHPEEDEAFSRWFDFTPLCTAKSRETVESVGLERLPKRSVDWGIFGALITATAVTTQNLLAERLAAISHPFSQTTDDVSEGNWVLVRSELPDVIGDMRLWTPIPIEPVMSSPAEAALAAVSDIQHWLAIGQDQVAALAGYSSRSVKNWREGMDPYPATVRRLFDLHALLGSLDRAMGTERVRLWLADTGPGGISRRERLADDAGLRSVVAEANAILFEEPTVAPLHALDFEEEGQRVVAHSPDVFSSPVRRVRSRS
jgi:hypothetical protein